jgi:hypothetical protein
MSAHLKPATVETMGTYREAGRTSDGIRCFNGPADVPALSAGLTMLAAGVIPLAPCLGLVSVCLAVRAYEVLALAALLAWPSLLCVQLGLRLLLLRRKLRRLVTAEQLHADADALQTAAAEQGVRPAFVINGRGYYEPDRLGEIARLLRPATAPVSDGLLRVAPPTDERTLPRPASL